jgi:hypothetical protein
MTKPVGRDEQMYCTGAVCMAQGKMIYRDFSYAAQMPYHPLLCAALFRLFDTTHYLLVVRLLSCVCDVLVMVCIVGIYRHIFKPFAITGVLLGLAAAVLYVFNPLVDYANGYAWNHDVVILCVVLSFWLFVSIDVEHKARYWRIGTIGALLTFATCMRITTAMVELLFFVVLLAEPAPSIKQRFKSVLPFLIAAVCVLVWPVWVIAQAPRAFFLNLVKIPTLYGEWLGKIGSVYDKSFLTFTCLKMPGYFVLIVTAVYLCLTTAFLRSKLKITNGRSLLLAGLLPLAFFIIALVPPTMWIQYLAMPVPFLIISFAEPLLYLRGLAERAAGRLHFQVACVVIGGCTLVAITACGLGPDPVLRPPRMPSYYVALNRILMVSVPEVWEPVRLHKISEDIAQQTKEPKLILTLAPLLALEGGGEIYTELSAGAIIYRIADSLSPDERRITHTAGPKSLPDLLEKNPPSAVILGVEMQRLEAPILESVVRADWQRKNYQDGPTAYFKP